MEIDVQMGGDSLSIPVDNPYRIDMNAVTRQIEDFAAIRGVSVTGLDIRGLLPRMVKGVAGCENGCPANALSLVREGFGNFELAYVEGGILKAQAPVENGRAFSIKIFPDF